MKTNEKYAILVKDLVAKGYDFKRTAIELNNSDLAYFSELAKSYGYKKPLLHSRGYGFYTMLRRVHIDMQKQ